MTNNLITLKNRTIITICGVDRKVFLQGLITNDINKVSEDKAIYTFLLSPQGRFLYDFFIIEKNETLFVDCALEKVDEIIQKLSFYKLRSKVEIAKENLAIFVSDKPLVVSKEEICFVDPRNSRMGYRSLVARSLDNATGQSINDDYNFHRLNLKIPDDSDLTYDKSFPIEFGFDNFNTIDYQKGCYVGQETTARMHYKGVIRKKIFLAEILNCNQVDKGIEIEADDKKIGEILSSLFYKNKLFALALIKNLDNEGKEVNLESLEMTIFQMDNSKKEIKIIK
jgi:hypothetical protein